MNYVQYVSLKKLMRAGTPIECPFDELTVLSNVEGLTALSLSRSSQGPE